MSRTDPADASGVALALQQLEPPSPGDEVVDLVEVDVTAEEPVGVAELPSRLVVIRGPQFGRHEGPLASIPEGIAEDPLGLAVHRGRVDHGRTTAQRCVDDGAAVSFAGSAADVEHSPGAQADHRQLDARLPQRSAFHGGILPECVSSTPYGDPHVRAAARTNG